MWCRFHDVLDDLLHQYDHMYSAFITPVVDWRRNGLVDTVSTDVVFCLNQMGAFVSCLRTNVSKGGVQKTAAMNANGSAQCFAIAR